MRSQTIYSGVTFSVISYGNGTAYKVIANLEDESVFFQGDDARQFRDEWEAYEKANPEMLIDDIIGEITSEYTWEKET